MALSPEQVTAAAKDLRKGLERQRDTLRTLQRELELYTEHLKDFERSVERMLDNFPRLD
jgi:hypothetical protein